MLPAGLRRLRLVLATVLLSAALPLVGCSGDRSLEGHSSLPPLSVGEPVLDKLMAGAGSANVVICVLDAARADHVGCYGYPRDTTPNIDRLAKESVVFRNHFSACSSTQSSTTTLLTGLYPDTHRFGETQEVAPGTFTLAQALKTKGLGGVLFTSNLVASPETGLDAGLDQIFPREVRSGSGTRRDDPPTDDYWRTPEGLTEAFGKWLRKEKPGRFFAYLHFLPPHNPYDAPETFLTEVMKKKAPALRWGPFPFPEVAPSYGPGAPSSPGQWVDLYDANLRWGDWGIGEVMRLLRTRDLLDSTLLIVTADHGEAFGEHGYIYHALAVYDEFIHIPLVVRFPGPQRLVGKVTALTQTVDVLPTVCDLYQASYPRETVQGRSLLPLLDGSKSTVRDYVFALAVGPTKNWPSYVIRDARWSLFLYKGGEMRALYDWQRDPGQRENIYGEHPETTAKMIAAFEAFGKTQQRSVAEFLSPQAAAAAAPRLPRHLSEKARRELKALGYLK